MRKSDIEAMHKCNIFSGLSVEQIRSILERNANDIHVYKKGNVIFSPESYTECLAVILKGKAEVSKNNGYTEFYMNTLSEGDMFGMSCLFSDKKVFPATVSSKEDCRILMLTPGTLLSVFSAFPGTTEKYISLLSGKIHFLNEKIDTLSKPNAKMCIKEYLENEARKTGKTEFTLPVSIIKLSEMLSVGRTSVYRAMDELTEEGFMERNGKAIKIL